MPKWKGKEVSQKRLFDLKAHAEWRRMCERGKFGFNYFGRPTTIGGNKNSEINNINWF